MEKKFRIKSIRRETEDKIEYLEDFTDCIITVEEVERPFAEDKPTLIGYSNDAMKMYDEQFGKKEGCIRCGHDGFWFSRTYNSDGQLYGDKCGQIQSQPVVESEICEECGGIDRCLCVEDEILKIHNEHKETLKDKIKIYLGSPSPVCPDGKVSEHIAKIALEYCKDNPAEIDCVTKKQYDELRDANNILSGKLIEKGGEFLEGFKYGINSKTPKKNILSDLEVIVIELEKENHRLKEENKSKPFKDLIWYLKSSIKGMVSMKKVLEVFDSSITKLVFEENVTCGDLRIIRTALQNMEKK